MSQAFDQTDIIKQLNLFLTVIKSPFRFDEEGICNGISILSAYFKLLKKEKALQEIFERLMQYDEASFANLSRDSVDYNDFDYLKMTLYILQLEHKNLINTENQTNITGALNHLIQRKMDLPKSMMDVRADKILVRRDFYFSFLFYKNELQQTLEKILVDNKVYVIAGCDHAINIDVDLQKNRFRLTDPNDSGFDSIYDNFAALTAGIEQKLFTDFEYSAEKMEITISALALSTDPQKISVSKPDLLKQFKCDREQRQEFINQRIAQRIRNDDKIDESKKSFLIETFTSPENPFDCIDDFRTTALHCAAENNDLETVEILLKYEVDTEKRDKAEKTACDYAVDYGYSTIQNALKPQQPQPQQSQLPVSMLLWQNPGTPNPAQGKEDPLQNNRYYQKFFAKQ